MDLRPALDRAVGAAPPRALRHVAVWAARGLSPAPPWSGLVDLAERVARGGADAADLACAVPAVPPPDGEGPRHIAALAALGAADPDPRRAVRLALAHALRWHLEASSGDPAGFVALAVAALDRSVGARPAPASPDDPSLATVVTAPDDVGDDLLARAARAAWRALGEAGNYYGTTLTVWTEPYRLSVHRVGGKTLAEAVRELEAEIRELEAAQPRLHAGRDLRSVVRPGSLPTKRPGPYEREEREARTLAYRLAAERGPSAIRLEDPETGEAFVYRLSVRRERTVEDRFHDLFRRAAELRRHR